LYGTSGSQSEVHDQSTTCFSLLLKIKHYALYYFDESEWVMFHKEISAEFACLESHSGY